MKPLKLTMEAFGSYGKKVPPIDFREPAQNLFLITGDTGAGKTTIFDAIVFALYGEASSNINKKDGAELQSQFTGLEVEPFVELTFSGRSEQDIYTVRRVPRHRRPLKKGTGIKDEKESVVLTMPDGTVYPEKDTDKKLVEILGLTKEQFMQVAMIAQGEFMELLRARSDEKKVIFRKLFGTEVFQDIADELGRRKKEKEKEMAAVRTAYQTEAAHIQIPGDYEHAEELEELRRRITAGDKVTVTDMEQLLESLRLLCTCLEEKTEKAGETYAKACELRDARRDACGEAEHVLKFFRQLDQAGRDLAWCREQEPEMKEIARLIAGIQAACEIRAEYSRYEEAVRMADDVRRKGREQKELLPELKKRAREAEEAESAAREGYDRELEHYSRVSAAVAAAMELFARIDRGKKETEEKEEEHRQAGADLERQERALADLESLERQWREKSEELKDTGRLLALCENKKREAAGLAEAAAEAGKLDEEAGALEKEASAAREAYGLAREEYEQENGRYEAARKAFLDAQAGFLAMELRPGFPCPVCGSTEHPAPCRQTGGHEKISREELDCLGEKVNRLRVRQEEAASRSRSRTDMAEEKRRQAQTAAGKLRLRAEETIPRGPGEPEARRHDSAQTAAEQMREETTDLRQIRDRICLWQKQIGNEEKDLKDRARILEQVQRSLAEAGEKKEGLREAAAQARNRVMETAAALEGSRAALAGLEQSREYAGPREAGRAGQEAGERKEIREKAYREAAGETEQAKKAGDQAETLIRRYDQELPGLDKEVLDRRERYEAEASRKGLAEKQWRELTENYSRDDCDRLREKAEAFGRKQAAAAQMAAAAREAIGSRERPDMEKLQQLLEEAEAGRRQAEAVWEQDKTDYRADDQALKALEPRMEERRRIVEEHTRLDTLYSLVSGKVTGARMDLETYVQRYYLEQILRRANRRFLDMSAGQFELRLYDLEKAGEGRNRGLDLMVCSNVTGKEREIRTLSGGESFMAALSLALGMADQIQETSAAVNLEMMFIDEGFGSLDGHSRNQAVRVLQEMAGGSRLIGIISHVTELKQEIDDQLIVTKDENGSHARWQIS